MIANPDNTPVPTLDELLESDLKNMGDEELRVYYERLRTLRKKDIAQILEDESLGIPEHEGFIYVLSNSAMPGLLKIGSTVGLVKKRAAGLSRMTSVPEPFTIERSFPVYANPKTAEKTIHAALDPFRSRKNREFFRLSIHSAAVIIHSVVDRQS